MDQFTLIAVLVILLVVALIVVNSGVRGWVVRVLGIESRVQGHETTTKVRASGHSTVKKVHNQGGTMDVEAKEGSDIEDIGNQKK